MKAKHLLLLLAIVSVCLMQSATAGFKTVIIDPGHGGHDHGGASGKVYEKHLALDTALRLEQHLKRLGYNTVMTRRSDYFVSLPQRMEIANRYKNAIFVSVHFNYTWKEGVSGLETFYFNGDGQRLANHVQNGMVRKTRTVDRDAKFARFYVIRNSQNPAILIEGGFVSNEQERERMKSGEFRESIARGVAEGIDRYRRGL
jgi:N-acetylmuramoyl-L-alanine amidase